MAEVHSHSATTQAHAPENHPVQTTEESGETHLSFAAKALFWLVVLPAAIMLAVKWLLQP
ncbi:MAG: hypothetical protein AB7G75_17470 [Candidatus Binatia bacterium]